MPLELDDFVLRKVNWPLPLRRGEWVGFSLPAKLLLSVMKPNCRRSLSTLLSIFFSFLDPHPWQETHPSITFLGIDLYFFPESCHGITGPYTVLLDKAQAFRKNFLLKKVTSNSKNGPKTRFLGLFGKMKSLFFVWHSAKWKYTWSFNIQQKLHVWEKLFLKLWLKNAPVKSEFSTL